METPFAEESMEHRFIVEEAEARQRLDRFLAQKCGDLLSRSRLKALILEGQVHVNGAPVANPAAKTAAGAEVRVTVPPPEDAAPRPQPIPLDIVYEDEWLLVLNKQAGLVVHPGAGTPDNTLVNALLHYCRNSLSGIGGVRRPGIVHRLDKDTTGLMIVAKTDQAHQKLAAQLADRSLARMYKALAWGVPALPKGTIDQPIGRHPAQRQKMAVNHRQGKEAVTSYQVHETYGSAACLLGCRLQSGRTHQIRVHMAHLGYPLIGDPVYGIERTKALSLLKKGGYAPEQAERIMAFPRQALHAAEIGFIHPASGETMRFTAPLPADMADLRAILKG